MSIPQNALKIHWQGRSSYDYDIVVTEMPHRIYPQQNVTETYNYGLNSSIIWSEGYSCFDLSVPVAYIGDDDYYTFVKETTEFLTSPENPEAIGILWFSNEPETYYKATLISQIDFSSIYNTYKQGTIVFHCQPFKGLMNTQLEKPKTYSGTLTSNVPIVIQADLSGQVVNNRHPFLKLKFDSTALATTSVIKVHIKCLYNLNLSEKTVKICYGRDYMFPIDAPTGTGRNYYLVVDSENEIYYIIDRANNNVVYKQPILASDTLEQWKISQDYLAFRSPISGASYSTQNMSVSNTLTGGSHGGTDEEIMVTCFDANGSLVSGVQCEYTYNPDVNIL